MTDIVERLQDWMTVDQTTSPASRMAEAADVILRRDAEIESLRQQLREANASLAECQAREKVLRDAIKNEVQYQHENYDQFSAELDDALAIPSDSTALDTMLKQAKREVLIEAANTDDCIFSGLSPSDLRRMAEELK